MLWAFHIWPLSRGGSVPLWHERACVGGCTSPGETLCWASLPEGSSFPSWGPAPTVGICAEGFSVCNLGGSLSRGIRLRCPGLPGWAVRKKELASLAVCSWPWPTVRCAPCASQGSLGLDGFGGIRGWCTLAAACCGVCPCHGPALGAPLVHGSSGRTPGVLHQVLRQPRPRGFSRRNPLPAGHPRRWPCSPEPGKCQETSVLYGQGVL